MHSAAAEKAQGKALSRFFAHHFHAGAGRILSIRCHAPESLLFLAPANPVCLQTHRLLADRLQQRGFRVCTEVEGEFDLCVIEATKHKDENLYHIALGWTSLHPGGELILAAANLMGAESLRRHIAEASLPILGIWPLAKCRIIWLRKEGEAMPAPLAAWLGLGDYRQIPGTALRSCAGLFSADAIDAGTRLLCETLPSPMKGHGADFGSGYGALARHLLSHSDQIRRLDLYDVEQKALRAAELNLVPWKERCEIHYHWADVPSGVAEQGFDWIVMNPPFHAGRPAIPALGKSFIETAAAKLKRDGVLWLVANRHLPYESVLAECFADVVTISKQRGFKICRATRPRNPRR